MVREYGGLVVAEVVLLGYIGWMSTMMKSPTEYHYKAPTICKYARSARATMEGKCGVKFGSGDVPMPVHVPKALRGVVLQRGEGTLDLNIAAYEGIILTPRLGSEWPLGVLLSRFPRRRQADQARPLRRVPRRVGAHDAQHGVPVERCFFRPRG
jgi:hypothetical protein